ncbi:hypothetical protein SEA_REYNAULD_87 [Rhodococcus phage Reynauld]|uniref:Uncharacterized protein n=1 Tax=Rhodococcus phage Reynauld TaxID=3062845 RepID=A0ACD4UHL6_9CAUD|nr:hypothetical protein SEA_REYNAULD_87 [Rhodococcus phage Reynauld]
MTAPTDQATGSVTTVDVLSAFKDLIADAIVEAPDCSDEQKNSVYEEYVGLDRNAKTTARTFVESEIRDAVRERKFPEAQVLSDLRDGMVSAAKSAAASTPRKRNRNRTEETVATILPIQLGYSLAMIAAQEEAGLDPNWQEQIAAGATPEAQERAQQYRNWLLNNQSGEEPEANEAEKAGARISLGRAAKGQGRRKTAKGGKPAVSNDDVAEFNQSLEETVPAAATAPAEAVAPEPTAPVAAAPAQVPASAPAGLAEFSG